MESRSNLLDCVVTNVENSCRHRRVPDNQELLKAEVVLTYHKPENLDIAIEARTVDARMELVLQDSPDLILVTEQDLDVVDGWCRVSCYLCYTRCIISGVLL